MRLSVKAADITLLGNTYNLTSRYRDVFDWRYYPPHMSPLAPHA
jgi:hypothetical protein